METLYEQNIFLPDHDTYCVLTGAANIKHELHNHDFYEIFIVLNGNLTHLFCGQEEQLARGAICLIYPDDAHGYKEVSDDLKMMNMAISAPCAHSLLAFAGEDLRRTCVASEAFCTQFLKLWPQQPAKALILQAMLQLCFVPPAPPAPQWLQKLHDDLQREAHFTEGIDYAKRNTAKSLPHISRAFKKHYNTTLIEYITALRLQHAQTLLRTSAHPVIQIAMMCGFYSVSHFNHIFKEHFSCTPTTYRSSNDISI